MIDEDADSGTYADDAMDSGLGAVDDAGPSEDDLRPLPSRSREPHCTLNGTRAEDLPRVEASLIAIEDAQRFEHAVAIETRDADPDAIYIVLQTGLVQRVDLTSSPATVSTVLDLSGRLACCDHSGLRGAAFHPDFADNGLLFVHYVVGTPARSVIARIALDPNTLEALPGTEQAVLEVEHPGMSRAGGPLLFDRSGMLLVALGDGGEDPFVDTQRDPRLGALLRLDVSTAPDDASYQVPADNPFVGRQDAPAAPEAWAYGLADPSSCALDDDGTLYCVDRGLDYSELNVVSAGRNYGWPEVDGPLCVRTGELCLQIGEVARAAYAHFEGRCGATGGIVASSPSELAGTLSYADACDGTLFGIGLRGEHAGKQSTLGRERGGARAMGRDADGAWLLIREDGVLKRLQLARDGLPGTFPELLSETHCFEGTDLQQAAPDLIDYEVASPLWSDGTHKRRFIVIPQDAYIDAPDQGEWTFPTGTILVKEFALQRDDQDPSSVLPVETRFMQLTDSGWEFHSYRWNDAGTDAVRVTENADVEYETRRDGRPYTQAYQFPDKDACPTCHGAAPGRSLGVRTAQLNLELPFVSGTRNQLDVLGELELFARAPGVDHAQGVRDLPSLPDYRDAALPIEARARSYLESNCAHCHQPGGYSSPDLTMDLRYELSLAETNICDQPTLFFTDVDRLIAPGDPSRSALWVRMGATDLDRMPPVATNEVDALGLVIMTRWIESLRDCAAGD